MWEQCLLQLSYLFDHFHHIVRNAQQSVGSNLSVSLQIITHPAQERLTTPPGSTYLTLFEQWCRSFYVPQEQISEGAVRQDLRVFILIRED